MCSLVLTGTSKQQGHFLVDEAASFSSRTLEAQCQRSTRRFKPFDEHIRTGLFCGARHVCAGYLMLSISSRVLLQQKPNQHPASSGQGLPIYNRSVQDGQSGINKHEICAQKCPPPLSRMLRRVLPEPVANKPRRSARKASGRSTAASWTSWGASTSNQRISINRRVGNLTWISSTTLKNIESRCGMLGVVGRNRSGFSRLSHLVPKYTTSENTNTEPSVASAMIATPQSTGS